MSFALHFEEVTGGDIGAAAFHALVAAGWVMFQSMQMIWMTSNVSSTLPSLEQRERWAREAFNLVCGGLPVGNPYAHELSRYVEEEVPLVLRKNTPPMMVS